jgi:hypothetical protein
MSEMDFEAQARMAAQRAGSEVAMVDIPEADAVVGRRRAHHRARNAVAGAVAVVILGGGVAFAVANASGSSKSATTHEPTTTTTTAVAVDPEQARLRAWIDGFISQRDFVDYADYVRTTQAGVPVYKVDLHGVFVWDHSCPANAPPSACVSTGNDAVLTLDARDLRLLDETVGNAADLTKFGAVHHIFVNRAELQFRQVVSSSVYSAASCGQIGLIGPNDSGAFRDNTKVACYTLGPTVLTGASISEAQAAEDQANGGWQVDVTFGNDDFVTKVAKPYVNQNIAMVVDGVVYSAPRINPGITGRTVTISGQFTEQQAKNLAAALSTPVTVPAPTTTTTTVAPIGLYAAWTRPTLVITPTSLGAVKLGMTRAQAESAAGEPFNGSGDGYVYPTALPAGYAHDFVGVTGDKVSCIGAADWSSATQQGLTQKVVTPEGVKLDDTVQHLLAVYPNAKYIPAPPVGMTTDAGYVVRQATGDLAFSVFQGQVRKISGGPHGQTPNSCTG